MQQQLCFTQQSINITNSTVHSGPNPSIAVVMAKCCESLDTPPVIEKALTCALDATADSFSGDDCKYQIEKSETVKFFENVKTKLVSCSERSFVPCKEYLEKNESPEEFPIRNEGLTKGEGNRKSELAGRVKFDLVPHPFKFVGQIFAVYDAIQKNKRRKEWSSSPQAIPPGFMLKHSKGFAVRTYTWEVSLFVPMLKVQFYCRKNLLKKEYTHVPAIQVLENLHCYSESSNTALFEIDIQVESEHHELIPCAGTSVIGQNAIAPEEPVSPDSDSSSLAETEDSSCL